MALTLPALPHMPRQLPWAARLCTMLLLVRASCDPLLEAAKSQSNGMGLGAALNALMLAIAARYALFRPQPLMAVVLPMWAPFLLAGLASVAIAPDASGALRLLLVQ